jgi:hypothetical protein
MGTWVEPTMFWKLDYKLPHVKESNVPVRIQTHSSEVQVVWIQWPEPHGHRCPPILFKVSTDWASLPEATNTSSQSKVSFTYYHKQSSKESFKHPFTQ